MMTQPAPILRCPVQSSLLASVGYCPFTCTFDVELRDGSLYRYYGVPAHICWNLLCADSKGRYFNRHVKTAFPHQRVSPPRRSVGSRRQRPQPQLAPKTW
jgi:hypothetical protein